MLDRAPCDVGVLMGRGGAPDGPVVTPFAGVFGLSDRWRSEGIGPGRRAVAAGADVPILFVRRGLRPGGIAPPETMTQTMTRFTWTIASQPADPAA